jgi:hypothetical protein
MKHEYSRGDQTARTWTAQEVIAYVIQCLEETRLNLFRTHDTRADQTCKCPTRGKCGLVADLQPTSTTPRSPPVVMDCATARGIGAARILQVM